MLLLADYWDNALKYTAGIASDFVTVRRIYEVNLLGAANVIEALYEVASARTSLICVASMAGSMVSLSSELAQHLATAPSSDFLATRISIWKVAKCGISIV